MSKSAGDDSEASGAPQEPGDRSEEVAVWLPLMKTLRHFLPNFVSWLASTPDPRDPRFTTYPIAYLLGSGLLLFLTKLGARRQIGYQFKTPSFIRNLNALCGTSCDTMLHSDTLAYLMKRLPPSALEDLRHAVLYELIRGKVFDGDRLLGEFLRVAIDGTGHLAFRERHCPHCLTQERAGKMFYYHPVLEAKLVTPGGFSMSMATEFIENSEPGMDKQDCERKAFVRLAEGLKHRFPQLRICLLMDSLYACGPVFARCRSNDWPYLITFKEGSAPAVFGEYERLKAAGALPHVHPEGDVLQTYWWVRGVDFNGQAINVLECQDVPTKGEARRFVWATDLPITPENCALLANQGGRLRWKIENEGFNAQKNNGYELEHAYSEHGQAAKNFYLLLQIAHLIAQLLEKGLLAKVMAKRIGALRNVARFLLEELRRITFDPLEVAAFLDRRIQIRFADTS
jgi:hypothetical protein